MNAKGRCARQEDPGDGGDDQGNPQVGVAAAEKVAADRQSWGPASGAITSVTCIPASEVLDRSNVVLISPGCTNPKVTDRGLRMWPRLARAIDFQAPAGAVWLIEDLKKKKIAVFDDGTNGSPWRADEFERGQDARRHRSALRHPRRRQGLPADLGTIRDVDAIYASSGRPMPRSSSAVTGRRTERADAWARTVSSSG